MFQRIGFMEIALVVGVGLIFFGPAKLPQLGKAVGDSIRQFKRSVSGAEETADSAGADRKA